MARRESRKSPPSGRFRRSGGIFLSPSGSGRWAERWVRCILRLRGWRILGSNVRTPFCEIDLLAVEGKTLVLVEVKFRRQRPQSRPLSHRQADRLRRGALWLNARRSGHDGVRIDLVEVYPGGGWPIWRIEHLRAAVVDGPELF
ncbi:MAG TPA: YraN family protein [Planctomycetes bacterium]|nr:YraN family protein [Planctomycetota bacterium]HIK81624.1 YraN family protein [Planctomycetota bacterium]